MIIIRVMNPVFPLLMSFLKLNSNPMPKSRNMTPISPQMLMLSVLDTVGKKLTYGPAKKPAMMYPSTTGCLSHLKTMVTIPATINKNARSLIIGGR